MDSGVSFNRELEIDIANCIQSQVREQSSLLPLQDSLIYEECRRELLFFFSL